MNQYYLNKAQKKNYNSKWRKCVLLLAQTVTQCTISTKKSPKNWATQLILWFYKTCTRGPPVSKNQLPGFTVTLRFSRLL